MLFGKIDIDLVLGGFYAELKPATRIILHVISATANFKTGEFYHSARSLATLAGYSTPTAERSLRELLHPPWLPDDHEQRGMLGIISIGTTRPGRPTVYIYNFLASAEDRGGYSTEDPRPEWDPEFLPPSPLIDPSITHDGTPPSPMMDKQDPPNESLFTTTAFDCLPGSLITKMRQTYGQKIVDVVISAMKGMNGEIKNPPGYFTACCKNGWVPTSKAARKQKKKQARHQAIAKSQQESRQKHDQMIRDFEESDPHVAAREIAKANRILGIQKH